VSVAPARGVRATVRVATRPGGPGDCERGAGRTGHDRKRAVGRRPGRAKGDRERSPIGPHVAARDRGGREDRERGAVWVRQGRP
jgi:hypothetical protein